MWAHRIFLFETTDKRSCNRLVCDDCDRNEICGMIQFALWNILITTTKANGFFKRSGANLFELQVIHSSGQLVMWNLQLFSYVMKTSKNSVCQICIACYVSGVNSQQCNVCIPIILEKNTFFPYSWPHQAQNIIDCATQCHSSSLLYNRTCTCVWVYHLFKKNQKPLIFQLYALLNSVLPWTKSWDKMLVFLDHYLLERLQRY